MNNFWKTFRKSPQSFGESKLNQSFHSITNEDGEGIHKASDDPQSQISKNIQKSYNSSQLNSFHKKEAKSIVQEDEELFEIACDEYEQEKSSIEIIRVYDKNPFPKAQNNQYINILQSESSFVLLQSLFDVKVKKNNFTDKTQNEQKYFQSVGFKIPTNVIATMVNNSTLSLNIVLIHEQHNLSFYQNIPYYRMSTRYAIYNVNNLAMIQISLIFLYTAIATATCSNSLWGLLLFPFETLIWLFIYFSLSQASSRLAFIQMCFCFMDILLIALLIFELWFVKIVNFQRSNFFHKGLDLYDFNVILFDKWPAHHTALPPLLTDFFILLYPANENIDFYNLYVRTVGKIKKKVNKLLNDTDRKEKLFTWSFKGNSVPKKKHNYHKNYQQTIKYFDDLTRGLYPINDDKRLGNLIKEASQSSETKIVLTVFLTVIFVLAIIKTIVNMACWYSVRQDVNRFTAQIPLENLYEQIDVYPFLMWYFNLPKNY